MARRSRRTAPVTKTTTEPTNPNPNKQVHIEVKLSLIISVGREDTRSIEQLREDVKNAVLAKEPAARVTNTGGYYLVNGKVCLPDDYDPVTRDFKPGRHAPLWAMSSDERDILARIEREKKLPMMARQPQNLRTSKEADRFNASQQKPRSTKDALADFHENTEAGRRRAAEKQPQDDGFLDDEFEDVTDLLDLDDLDDDEALGGDLDDMEEDAVAILSGKKSVGAAPKKRVVRSKK